MIPSGRFAYHTVRCCTWDSHRIAGTSLPMEAKAVSGSTLSVMADRPFSRSLRAAEQASIVGERTLRVKRLNEDRMSRGARTCVRPVHYIS